MSKPFRNELALLRAARKRLNPGDQPSTAILGEDPPYELGTAAIERVCRHWKPAGKLMRGYLVNEWSETLDKAFDDAIAELERAQ